MPLNRDYRKTRTTALEKLMAIGDTRAAWLLRAALGLATLVLAACGGSGSSGNAGAAANLLNCPAANNATSNGYSLGVCSASGGTQNKPVYRGDLSINVTVNNYAAKAYTLNLNAETGPSTVAFGSANEDRCQNLVGAGRINTETVPNPARGVYAAVLSGTQKPTDPIAGDSCFQAGGAGLPPALNVPLTFVDFGTWERYVGGQSFYYGGWYTALGSANVKPAAAKTYSAGGLSFGYVYTTVSSFGTAGVVSSVAVDATGTITGTVNDFQNSRTGFDPSLNAQIVSLTMAGTAAADGTFSGTLTGVATFGASGPQQAILGGGFEGRFFGPNGEEIAGRWWVQLSNGAIAVGSFGAH
jgi:hypothetical protein